MIEQLSVHYYARSTANAYISFGKTSGFDIHNDDHDVIILQVEGKKKWRFLGCNNRSHKATIDQLRQPTEKNISEEIVISAGDILFIPKGTWHDVLAINQPSLHLTISLVYPSVQDYIDWLLQKHQYNLPYQNIKVDDNNLEEIATQCQHFFKTVINGSSISKFLKIYYARYSAFKMRPSFPFLNRAELEEKFKCVPFNFIELDSNSCHEKQRCIFALTKKYFISELEYKILAQLLHKRELSGTDLLISLNEDQHVMRSALQCLLNKGLISKESVKPD